MGGVFSGGNKTELTIDNTVEIISNTIINISQSFSSSTQNIQIISLDCTDENYLAWQTECADDARSYGYSADDVIKMCPTCCLG